MERLIAGYRGPVNPYGSPDAPPPAVPAPARQRSAGLIALAAAAATLVVVVVISTVLVMTLTEHDAMYERGRLVGRGAAQLALCVGLVTYAVIKLRRSAAARRVAGR
jgi:hypothetical protein